ncbi:MAG: hypothetical protein A2Z77_05360 [Chloroflexi bacterium RBG_13_51_36]|nr:MAG: hypothetical protein A2Z77_05360 [Chloroflexi bacterium RBG_13_51_36]
MIAKKVFTIKQQVVKDLATGLTIEFKAREDGEFRLYLSGSILPLGNREIHFGKEGDYVGAGTWLKGK